MVGYFNKSIKLVLIMFYGLAVKTNEFVLVAELINDYLTIDYE